MGKKIRFAGILLHPTSLSGGDGIGDLGKNSYRFVDFLADTKVGLWQILPLGPVGFGNSPYASRSSFAGNELLINLDFLADKKYLSLEQIEQELLPNTSKVDFESVANYKYPLLVKAANSFIKNALDKDRKLYERFCAEQSHWLEDYALFQSVSEHYQDSRWFLVWDKNLAKRDKTALEDWKKEQFLEVEVYKVLQFFFHNQWHELKAYANKKGVAIVGDLPIFVAHDSADAWANQDLLKLDKEGHLKVSSGVPPDAFSVTGQLWGNPL
ncbi:MAG: 4-alpha-glucanotransferase, partial [Sphaerochaetaceae bacterium]